MRKLAARNRGAVKGYVRVRGGKTETVRPHTREIDEKDEPKPDSPWGPKDRRTKDYLLWKKWKEGGEKPEDLRPILAALKGTIFKAVNSYKGQSLRNIPDSALELEFYTQALAALRTYTPGKGAAIHTWVTNYLKKGHRFVLEHQNIGRIPETRGWKKIKSFKSAEEELRDKYGRPASDEELAGFLGWKVAEVVRMSSELRKDLRAHAFEDDMQSATRAEDVASREREVLRMLRHELTEDERKVYDLIVTKNVSTPSILAKKTGFPLYKVSRLKAAIARKAKPHL